VVPFCWRAISRWRPELKVKETLAVVARRREMPGSGSFRPCSLRVAADLASRIARGVEAGLDAGIHERARLWINPDGIPGRSIPDAAARMDKFDDYTQNETDRRPRATVVAQGHLIDRDGVMLFNIATRAGRNRNSLSMRCAAQTLPRG
jgi:hypothetical protein